MADLPDPIQRLDAFFSTARIAHENIADMHRELVELDADDPDTLGMLRASAAVILEEMPRLTRKLREEEREWDEQQMLDPGAAERTLSSFAARLGELEPALARLRTRQAEIAASMLARVQAARET